jgi:4'-phosphopantetheinyl transferase
VALLCFAHVEVGVDVERMRPVARADRIIARVFSESTRRCLAAVPTAERASAFFAAWTQREALVKAVGGALMVTSDPLDFEWPVQSELRHFDEKAPSGTTRRWTVATLPQPVGYAAALVAAGPLERLRLLRYTPTVNESADD